MDILNSFFKNLIFTRVDEKQGYIIYGACVSSGLGAGTKRYILLFVPSHLAFKNQGKIDDLPWQNLQTRQLSYSYRLKHQSWTLPRGADNIVLHVQKRDKNYSTYKAQNFPFEVLLLHNPKKKTSYQYHNKLGLKSSIETFSAVFNYTGDTYPIFHTSISNKLPSPVNKPVSSGNIPSLPTVKNWFRTSTNETLEDDDDSFEFV